MKTQAEKWLDAHGFEDGSKWAGFIPALHRCLGEAGGPSDPCRWEVENGEGYTEIQGYVWPDGSGVYMADAYWDTVPSGQVKVRGPV